MKTEKKQHLKGSVLFTVVSVMSLLVIFLMGTLVLATSASNRSHKNYSTSQAEYTARAAIESFSQAMGRNAAVAQTVVDMSKNTSIQPTVVMEDSQMGSVGYYNDSGAWVDDKINVEYVDDTYVYSDGKWEEQQVLRVTATAQVGKEESTVSLYLRKKAPNEPNPLTIKGFQTLGDGGYTTTEGYISGAVSMGILDDGNQDYYMGNGSKLDTEINFINGNFNLNGQGYIYASEPGSGTVVMGDMTGENPIGIFVDYAYASKSNSSEPWEYIDMTHKNIPYLYVDGMWEPKNGSFVKASGVNTVTEMRAGAPFNIFCGTFNNSGGKVILAADLYIMDENGVSTFGFSDSSSALVEWSSSVLNKTDAQFYSEGGNIYCNGTLKMNQGKINGDVRVKKDFYVGSHAIIVGDLVVEGNIYDASGNLATPAYLASIVRGTVYNGTVETGGTGGLKEGYFSRKNTYVSGDYLKPGYVKVHNFEYPNFSVPNITYPNFTDDPSNYIKIFENTPYTGEYEEISISQSASTSWNWVTSAGVNITEFGLQSSDIIQYTWDNSLQGNVTTMYVVDGTGYANVPYVDAIDSTKLTASATSTYLVLEDGTYVDTIPEGDSIIFQADETGAKTNIITDSLSVTYKANIDGEIWLDENGNPAIVTEEYTYYEPDKDGNPSNVSTTSKSFMFIADINGNATDVTISDLLPEDQMKYYGQDESFTYYNQLTGEQVTKNDAIGSAGDGAYIAWYDSNKSLGGGAENAYFYYKADPTGHETDTGWLDANKVNASEALESVTVLPLSTYTDAGNEIYPSSMTRDALDGTADGGKYKVITTLDDVKESIGLTDNFNKNVYYDQVPVETASFKELTVSSNNKYTINENTIIRTDDTQSGPIIININPNGGELWIVLDNCDFSASEHRIIVNGNGTVNFFIKDKLTLTKSAILTKNIYDQMQAKGKIIVREDDKLNINYYGSQNSEIVLEQQSMLTGIAKCPYTKLTIDSTNGISGNYVYINSEGVTKTFTQVAWIGNALFKEKLGSNNFTLLYTGSSAEQDDIDNELLKQSWKVMYYDVY